MYYCLDFYRYQTRQSFISLHTDTYLKISQQCGVYYHYNINPFTGYFAKCNYFGSKFKRLKDRSMIKGAILVIMPEILHKEIFQILKARYLKKELHKDVYMVYIGFDEDQIEYAEKHVLETKSDYVGTDYFTYNPVITNIVLVKLGDLNKDSNLLHRDIVDEKTLTLVAKKNHHCKQLLDDYERIKDYLEYDDLITKPLDDIEIELTSESKRMPYQTRPVSIRSSCYRGQLKLFIWLLEIVLRYCLTYKIFHYAGAAPGQDIFIIAKLFPECMFYLYDPRPFCDDLTKRCPKNVILINDFFTYETAEKLRDKGEDFFFISDIRSDMSQEEVKKDMEMQWGFYKIMNVPCAMKCRFYWRDGITEYPAGRLEFQAFEPTESTETRIYIEKNAETVEYDNIQYEQICAYHNCIRRSTTYKHDIKFAGLDRCYDCSRFVRVALKYHQHMEYDTDNNTISKFMTKIIKRLHIKDLSL